MLRGAPAYSEAIRIEWERRKGLKADATASVVRPAEVAEAINLFMDGILCGHEAWRSPGCVHLLSHRHERRRRTCARDSETCCAFDHFVSAHASSGSSASEQSKSLCDERVRTPTARQ